MKVDFHSREARTQASYHKIKQLRKLRKIRQKHTKQQAKQKMVQGKAAVETFHHLQ